MTFAPLYGPYNITFTTYNDSGNGAEIASAKATYTVNYNLVTPTLSLSTNALDVGQSAIMTVKWNYPNNSFATGTPPFTVNLYSSSTSSCGGSGATLVDSSNDITTYSESFTVSPTTTGTIYYCAVVKDSSYGNPETKSSTAMPLYVAGTPTIRLSVTNFNYDQGQSATFGFALNGGIGPFEVSLISAQNGSQIGNTLTLNSPGSSGSFTFNLPNTPGSYSYYVKAIDEETNNGGASPYTFESSGSPDSITYTVSPTLSVPSISLSSNLIEQGQPFSASLSWTGGTEPYTANVYIYNATSNALMTGLPGLSLGGISSDTANIPIQSNDLAPGTYYLKATVADSSGTGPETNSSLSGNFVITAAPKIIETLSSNSLTYPNFPTVKIKAVNGTPPYSVAISISNPFTGFTESNSVTINANNGIANYSTGTLDPGTYFANVTLTDSASPAVTAFSSKLFTVNSLTPSLSLEVPSSFTYNAVNATVTASVYPSGLTGNLIMSVNGGTGIDVVALTSSSNTITYNAPASAGSYSFTLATDANAIYSAESTTANYIISQYNPKPSISVLPSNSFTYDGSNAIISYGLTTYYSNTIGIDLYVNNTLVQSSTELPVNLELMPIKTSPYYGYYGAAVSQNGTYLYSPAYYYNLISVINTKTSAVVKNINSSLLNGPTGIVIPNNTGNAYITNYLNGTLAVFNLSTNTVEKDIPLSSNSLLLSSIKPYYIAASPDGKLLYVTDYGTDSITVVNTSTGTVIKNVSLPSSSGPYSIALSQNGNTIYVAENSSSLYLINTSTYTVTAVSLSQYLTKAGSNMALVGSNLYIPADAGSTGVVVYNTATGTLSAISGIPSGMTAVSALGGYVFASNSSLRANSVTYIVNVSSGSLMGSINTGSNYTEYSVTDGSDIYLINYENFTELKNITVIKNISAPTKFNFAYTGPAAVGSYSLKAVPVLSGNYVPSNAVSTLTISPASLKVVSSLPSNSVYTGTNFTVTAYNANASQLGLSATLNGNTLPKPSLLNSNGITTVPFYAGAESKNGTAYFTTESNTVYYYPPGSTFGNDIIYLPSGFESYGIAISNVTDYAYVSSYAGNTILVLNLATNKIVNSIVLPNSSSEIYYDVLSKNDTVLYASNYGTNSIDAINLATNAITQISLGSDSYPFYMVLSPSGRHLYVSGYYYDFTVINTTTNTLQYRIPTSEEDTGQISISSNGEYLYIPIYYGEYVEVYNTHTRSTVKNVPVYYPYISAVSGGNVYLFSYDPSSSGYSGSYAYGVVVLNTTTNAQVGGIQTVPFYEDPYYAFTGKNGTVYLIGPSGYENEANNYTIVAIKLSPETEYSLPAAAGTYALDFQIPNSNYTGIGVSNDIYTISKATPDIHLSGIASSYVYTGNSINATATFSISNTLQPLGGTLMLNGNTIATYSANAPGHVQTAPINAINVGNYTLEFETPGNANYTPANIIENFVISAAAAHTSISVPRSFVYNGSNATVTASISPSNAIGNLYMSVNGGPYSKVDSSTAGFGSIAYNAPAVAGNYSFEFYNTGNVVYAEGFSIGNYSIYKAAPKMSFPQSCSTYTVDGLSCNTIASIETYNSQITAKLYLNGTLVGSTSNTITYTGSNSIGLYTYTFNETGNANYSADSITYAYEVQAPGSGHATSTSTSIATTTVLYIVNSTTTSTATTTVPQHTLNISSSTASYTGSFGTSAGKPFNISFGNLGMFVSFATPSPNSTNVNFTIANYTGTLPFFANHTMVKAFILNFTSAGSITANITTTYDCASGYPTAPYELVNGSLQPIVPYTVNPVTCTISFSVSSDPIVALYANTTVPTTTIAPTTTPATTVPAVPKPSSNDSGIIAALIIIVVAVIFAYALARRQKGR
ncbi:MAG: hypothetical protein LVQ97_04455 [Candidatus Micrarchaeales archaeon]|nr:hypothetical protein [Candidatus Micrarchaeales archaeon]